VSTAVIRYLHHVLDDGDPILQAMYRVANRSEDAQSDARRFRLEAENALRDLEDWKRVTEPVSKLPWREWHWCNLDIRINGENRIVEADWLKNIAYLREGNRRAAGLEDEPD